MDTTPICHRPLAANGLISYRCRSPYGWVMIGAKDHEDALQQAALSTANPRRADLEVWDGDRYVKVAT
jgi:hypothetical protein